MNRFLLKRPLVVKGTFAVVIFLLAACGRSPLALPKAEQVAQPPPTQQSAPTVRTIQELISPLPTPPAAPLRNDNFTPTSVVRATDAPFEEGETSQPGPQVVVLTPVTPTLSYEEALKEGEVTVGDYTFSLPQEVPDGRGPVSIIGWLPDSSAIIDAHNRQVVTIDMYTGQIHEFSDTFDRHLVWPAIWPLGNDKIAFVPDTGRGEIWISGSDSNQATAPVATNVYPFPILATDGKSLITYNPETQQVRLVDNQGIARQSEMTMSDTLDPLRMSQAIGTNDQSQQLKLYSATSPMGQWTAIYNQEHLSLVNLTTGETKALTLILERKGDYELQVETFYWSPNGEKVAVLASSGPPPILFMKLFVGEAENGQLREIVTGFQYVTNATWAPDSVNLLISADTGVAEAEAGYEYKTGSLFLFNLSSNELTFLPLLPEGSAIDFTWDLSWAPNGQAIALSTVLSKPGNPQLYRIDVDAR